MLTRSNSDVVSDDFLASASFIVSRNVSDHVSRVMVAYDKQAKSMSLIYCLTASPTENDVDDCELACGELLAEFPHIEHAVTRCVLIGECDPSAGTTVYETH